MTREGGWILKAAQQSALDAASIRAGTPNEKLMESAGTHAAEWILSHLSPSSAVVLAGPGGNGGDAFVVARHLLQAGTAVRTFSLRETSLCSDLTQTMAERLANLGETIEIVRVEPSSLKEALEGTDCIIDGLFGSGLSRPLIGDEAALIEILNEAAVPTISLDVPSGLAADTGEMAGVAIRADVTLAMAFYKLSHWLYPAAETCGDVTIVGVDYPQALVSQTAPTAQVPDLADIAAKLPLRDPAGHKGSFGHVLAVVGSQGMTGAAILSARGALRAGAGLVTVALPESIASVIQSAVPEATTIPLPDCVGRLADRNTLERLGSAMERADVLAIGPGLSRDPETLTLVRRICEAFTGEMVIDADAVHAFAGHAELLASLAGYAVLTPHPGEFAALMGTTATEVDVDRLEMVEDFVCQHALHLVLKGRPTVIGLPNRPLVINPTGNTGLATGGSGDVLTGLLAGLLASGSSLSDAAVAAPFVHGMAADRWSEGASERSLTPSDVLEALPLILKELER
ncbi:NAD(P)H-hydrate dehydratase [Candidatus Bipolaricaulota bacterium]